MKLASESCEDSTTGYIRINTKAKTLKIVEQILDFFNQHGKDSVIIDSIAFVSSKKAETVADIVK